MYVTKRQMIMAKSKNNHNCVTIAEQCVTKKQVIMGKNEYDHKSVKIAEQCMSSTYKLLWQRVRIAITVSQ